MTKKNKLCLVKQWRQYINQQASMNKTSIIKIKKSSAILLIQWDIEMRQEIIRWHSGRK